MASQVHLVFLYHPAADARSSPLLDAVVRRLENLYKSSNGATIFVARLRYGSSPAAAEKGAGRFLSSASSLSIAPFVAATTYWQKVERTTEGQAPSMYLKAIDDIKQPRNDSWRDALDTLMATTEGNSEQDDTTSGEDLGCLADGLVAAVELFARATPSKTRILARYMVHILPDNPPLDMNDGTFPHSNLDSSHDKWSWIRAAQELGKMAVWPSTHILPASPGSLSSSLTPECEKVHRCILDELPAVCSSITDSPSILGGSYKGQGNAQGMLLSGFNDAAATAARASASVSTVRKRGRKSSLNSRSQKPKLKEEDKGAAVATSESTDNNNRLQDSKTEIDKVAVNKMLFLQQQQQMMMRNLAIAARQHQATAPDQSSPSRQRLLEQFRDQLLAQQSMLKTQAAALQAGGAVPNFSNTLNTLIGIDREAREKGLHLGGPSGMQQAAMLKQKQLQQQQLQQQAGAPKVMPMAASALASVTAAVASGSNAAPSTTDTASSLMIAAADQQPRKPSGPQAFWSGAIMWSVVHPNKQRNQAIAFVSGHCAPNTSKETLMLPWQARLNITDIQSVSIGALQAYAARNSTSCALFQPLNVPAANRPQGGISQAQQQNEAMYVMLARMIDSKKSCAFIPLQGENCTKDAGLVLVPTPTQAGSNSRRLLGLVFRDAVPWHLFRGGAGVEGEAATLAHAQPTSISPQPSVHQQRAQAQHTISGPAAAAPFASSANANVSGVQIPMPSSQSGLFQPQQQMESTGNTIPGQQTPLQMQQQQQQQQSLPMWSQQLPSAAVLPSPLSSVVAVPAAFLSSTNPLSSMQQGQFPVAPGGNVDLQALARSFGLANQQQQQQQPPAFNPTIFSGNTMSNQPGEGVSGPSISSIAPPQQPVDLDALQRLLGLDSS